ncbi:putative metal-dependent hydrolase, partial [Vibrio parahaemolyticus V-223/04]
MPVTSSLTQ